jgi:hypothetical protein
LRGSSKSGNLKQAKAALVFQWGYGAFLVWLSVLGMCAPSGLVLRGAGFPFGVTSIIEQPTLYLDGRNAPFLMLLGLCLPLIFTWLRDKEGRYGPSYYVSANLLTLSLAGVFISDSLLLFYLFWETALLGAYFWIGMHGRANIHSGSVYSGPGPVLPVHLGGQHAHAGFHHRHLRRRRQGPGRQRHRGHRERHAGRPSHLDFRRVPAGLRGQAALARLPWLAPRHL